MAGALRPGGVLAIDICDLEFGGSGRDENFGRVGPDWAVITEFSAPAPDRFVRDITTFVPDGAARGGAAASATRTCSSTRPGYRRCWPATACGPR